MVGWRGEYKAGGDRSLLQSKNALRDAVSQKTGLPFWSEDSVELKVFLMADCSASLISHLPPRPIPDFRFLLRTIRI